MEQVYNVPLNGGKEKDTLSPITFTKKSSIHNQKKKKVIKWLAI